MFLTKRNKMIILKQILFIIIFFLISFDMIGQNKDEDEICLSCILYFDPISDFDLKMGDDKQLVLNFFEEKTLYNNEFIPEIEGVVTYEVHHEIILNNGYKTELSGLLKFLNNQLFFFNLSMSIGEDNTYFQEIIQMLRQSDVNDTNHFLYDVKKYFYYEQTEKCNKIFFLNRVSDNKKFFEISIKFSFTPVADRLKWTSKN